MRDIKANHQPGIIQRCRTARRKRLVDSRTFIGWRTQAGSRRGHVARRGGLLRTDKTSDVLRVRTDKRATAAIAANESLIPGHRTGIGGGSAGARSPRQRTAAQCPFTKQLGFGSARCNRQNRYDQQGQHPARHHSIHRRELETYACLRSQAGRRLNSLPQRCIVVTVCVVFGGASPRDVEHTSKWLHSFFQRTFQSPQPQEALEDLKFFRSEDSKKPCAAEAGVETRVQEEKRSTA
ncbi:hypothetical protein CA54_17900 [Symmachiella macrocystis]|uniref:Uncharacterized protein n=1 Tax=Symmachiella macrocystis TaxID=2527985 RepID=A0A5C6BQP8_9PLAN|nr:hypothetical protein CA54_17900 [Symmachiella macrocystis]